MGNAPIPGGSCAGHDLLEHVVRIVVDDDGVALAIATRLESGGAAAPGADGLGVAEGFLNHHHHSRIHCGLPAGLPALASRLGLASGAGGGLAESSSASNSTERAVRKVR